MTCRFIRYDISQLCFSNHMGCCCPSPSDPQDYQIKLSLAHAKAEDSHVIKLLLLGAGASGKSTLFKQLQYIHENGFNQQSRISFIDLIHEQLIDSMKVLVTKCEDYYTNNPIENAIFRLYDYNIEEEDSSAYDESDDENEDFKIDDDLLDKYHSIKSTVGKKSSLNVSSDVSLDERMEDENNNKIQSAARYIFTFQNSLHGKLLSQNPKMIQNLKLLWKHSAIQAMFSKRNEICVPDSTAHFYSNLDRITSNDYVPNDDDLLLVRHKTTGISVQTTLHSLRILYLLLFFMFSLFKECKRRISW